MTNTTFSIEAAGGGSPKFDDDGRAKRTGTLLTAIAHIITAVIGSGILSLAWTIAQLGWIAGPIALAAFSVITWFMSILLTDCYRSPNGNRNHNYIEAVKSYLGETKTKVCILAQYSILVGVTIGYSITGSISIVAMKRANCFHKHGREAGCHMSNTPFIAIFGVMQVVLSQIPNFHKLSKLSLLAAVMSFAYSFLGLGLIIAKITEGGHVERGLTGTPVGENLSSVEKMWDTFSALANIAFAYSFSPVLLEIQDTIKSGKPENQVMKAASTIGISITTAFYMAYGILGYAAFGNKSPGNLLTGFAFYEPYLLIDLANLCVAVHLVGAYQVFSQPVFAVIESWSRNRWTESSFICKEYQIGGLNLNMFRLVWRTGYVIFTTTVSMLFPFFNEFVGLLGSLAFWPLTVYFPIDMYIARTKIPRFSWTWILLQTLSGTCLIISLLAAAASIRGLAVAVQEFKPFHSVS